jgi:hypothetical protein
VVAKGHLAQGAEAIRQDCNLRWSLDFVSDTLVSGRRFRILTLVDGFTRECLGLVVDRRVRSSKNGGSWPRPPSRTGFATQVPDLVRCCGLGSGIVHHFDPLHHSWSGFS